MRFLSQLVSTFLATVLVLGSACGDDDGTSDTDGGPRRDGTVDPGTDGGDPPREDGGPRPDGGGPPPSVECDPLPASTGTEVRVGPSDADELPGMVGSAGPGTVFLLEDGMYRFTGGDEASRRIQIRANDVTIRSVSNDATAVILDGEYVTQEMITIHASNATLAHFTIMRAENHPIHVNPLDGGPNVQGTLLYGLRIIDGGEQFVKVNSNGPRDAWVDSGRVECSLFQLTDDGRPNVERVPGGCYTGGIDGHGVWGWEVRNNRFEDIYCAGEGLAEHAVHFWTGSRDTVVENNVIVNCARGVGFGLVQDGEAREYTPDPYPSVSGYIGHYDGIIRNNVIWADHAFYDTGVELAQAHGARVYHNTVVHGSGATGFFSSIDYRFANTDADIRNNITSRITQRDGAAGMVGSNLEGADLGMFADVGTLDFHLGAGASDAIDQGEVVAEAGVDMDGEPHTAGAGPDLGADEAAP